VIYASSFVSWIRCFVFRVGLLAPLAGVLLFGLAVGAGSLLVAGPALAAEALFRVEQRWHNAPFPPVTTPGGAGMDQGYIQPYTTKTAMGTEYIYPAPKAIVEPGNPIGGVFTLPASFIDITFTNVITPNTGWPGYTTTTVSVYYNGKAAFGPGNGGTAPTRIVFPTTGGNAYPNYGLGAPVTPTTTFDGLYDFSRVGTINVTPGPRRFGGSFKLFYRPEAYWYQYIYYFTPAIYKVYAEFSCLNNGDICTPGNLDSNAGDITGVYRGSRYLLNVKGSGTGDGLQTATAKATKARTSYGSRPTPSGNASFIAGAQQYLGMIHPWTTGFASVNAQEYFPITPQAQGYDISLGGADITVTHYDWNQVWDKPLSTIVTTTVTTKQYLYGVGRVVSMVRPRLIHTYSVPVDLAGHIENTWNVARMWRLKVFFLPEPTGMLMLGAGVVALLGLSRMRRR
jgi:hypothetical protein